MEIQELKLDESAQKVAELTERLKQYEADLEKKDSVSIYIYMVLPRTDAYEERPRRFSNQSFLIIFSW